MTTRKKQDKPQTEVEETAVAEVLTEDVVAVDPQPQEVEPLHDAEEHAAVPAEEAAAELPDHLAHRVTLEDYAQLRRVTDFQKAILTTAVGSYARPFDEWEHARQSVLGG